MQMNFRSAFNGFNREDVVHYIEFLNSKHAADLNQLNAELEYLRKKQPEQPAPAADNVVEQQAARIRELFDRCAALEQELDAAKAENAQLAAQVQQQDSGHSRLEDELEAYRRAERTEREAREREAREKVEAALRNAEPLAPPKPAETQAPKPAKDPNQILTLAFRVTAPRFKLIELKKFLDNGGYQYE